MRRDAQMMGNLEKPEGPRLLVTSAQMRRIEAAAMASGRVSGRVLMERAGCGVVAAIFDTWPELAADSGQAVVLAGPGNNGGDGFVVARLLARWGWQVDVLLLGAPDRLPPDARANLDRWRAMGGTIAPLEPETVAGRAPQLWVDAIFGTGLSRPVPAAVRGALELAGAAAAGGAGRIVAIDMPSWFSSDSGAHLGGGSDVVFDLVAAVAPLKVGHFTGAAPHHIGRLRAVDIGLSVPPSMEPETVALLGPDAARVCAKGMGHKYSHGHALVLAGGPGRTGAARMAARAALRVGAGLVTLGCPPAAQQECACHLTAVMLRRVEDADALDGLLADRRISSLCLGPALGLGAREEALVARALASRRPVVLDADALRLVAASPALREALHPDVVLTPHGGEFAALLPDLAARLAEGESKVDIARAAAECLGVVLLLKGPDTVIVTPDGRATINACLYEHAAPWLATAGAGDVLSGLVAGLLARGVSPAQAAAAAAWLHGAAARHFGPGLVAEDLPETLPAVMRAPER